MVEVEKISCDFGSFRAVDNVSFSIQTGEIVGLLGPNGAGKTTTMRMITGFLEPTSGSIQIDGQNIADYPKQSKGRIGYMPESAPLYSDMMVQDYLDFVAEMQGVAAANKVPRLAVECGLTEVMHKNISELSRGYRQRVGLAHALMPDPEILILDEPTSGLDPNQIIEVRNLIKRIGRTRTVIISTHILSEVEMLCDRVIIISQGKIVADSPTNELRQRFGHHESLRLQVGGVSVTELRQALSGLANIAEITPAEGEEGLAAVQVFVSGAGDLRPEVFQLIQSKGWILYEMVKQQNSLEDVFRNLTTGGNA